MKQLDIARDPNSIATYIIEPSEDSYSLRLAADTQQTLVVPAGAVKAIISADDYYFVSKSAIPALPITGAIAVKTGMHLAFDAMQVTPAETLYFRSRNATDMTVSFYD